MAAEFLVGRKKITRPPTHPGVLFERDILPELTRPRRTIGEIATLLGVSRQTVVRKNSTTVTRHGPKGEMIQHVSSCMPAKLRRYIAKL